MNSIKYGFCYLRMYYLALRVTYKQAKASLPSTLVEAIPIEIALGMIPSEAYWSVVGVDMAYLLFLHKNKVWHFNVAAKFNATGKSP